MIKYEALFKKIKRLYRFERTTDLSFDYIYTKLNANQRIYLNSQLN